MKKILLIALITGCWLPMRTMAQNAYIMYQPVKYTESPDGTVLTDSKSKTGTVYWIVCSDRAGNPIYNTADNSSPIGTANFMDKYYVTNEKGDYLEVYKYEEGIKADGGSKRNLLSKKAKRVGWINKSSLLLWFKALQDPVTHFTEKALAVVNEKNVVRTGQFVNKNADIKVYANSDLTRESNNSVRMFQFLYVYKRENGRSLIGKTHATSFLRVDHDVLGWVADDILQKWNDRVCLEPNSDPDAASKRKSGNVKVSLFFGKDEATQWTQGSPAPKPLWDDDTYDKRWPAQMKRLPILDRDGDLIRTGFATPLYNEQNVKVATTNDQAKVQKANNEVTRDARHVNIVFVIDGSAEMDKYVASIKFSLQRLVTRNNEYFQQGAEKNTYNYGAVIYRSLEDKNCNGTDLSISKIALTTQSDNVARFLDRELQKKTCGENSANRDVNGALTEALKMLRTVNSGHNIQSNYVLVIGEATGNKGPELINTPTQLANLEVNLSIFQVENTTRDEYEFFSTNFVDLIREATKKKYQMNKKTSKSTVAVREPDFKGIGDGSQNLYRLDYPDKSPLQGVVAFPEPGGTISAETIDNVLDTSFVYFQKSLENIINQVNVGITGNGAKNINYFSAAVQDYFQRIGMSMGDMSMIANFSGKNYQFFEPAWTSVKISKLEDPVFKHVIYASEEDLNEMISQFGKTIVDVSQSDLREQIYNAYQAMVVTYFGKETNITDEFKSRLTLDSVISKVTGLPSRSNLLKEIRLEDIRDVNKVTDEQIEKIQSAINESITKLNGAKADADGTMRDVTDDGIFYWIPEDYLP